MLLAKYDMIIGTDQSEYYKVIGVEREWCNVENPLIQFYFFLEFKYVFRLKIGSKTFYEKKISWKHTSISMSGNFTIEKSKTRS